MPNIIIPATKSLTVTDKIPNGNINSDAILVGNEEGYKYFSYLFFDISSIPENTSILNAELILFKMDNFFEDNSVEFGIYPIDDYFSTYTTFQNAPKISKYAKKSFYPLISKVALSINLTLFVSLWAKNSKLNSGIFLYSKNNKVLAKFGSSICSDNYLIPFLKVSYTTNSPRTIYFCKECCNEPPSIEKVRVIGTVAAESKYEAVTNVEVIRRMNRHIDNYYVVDEYDNSSGSIPLNIDKTYNIAVVPSKKTGDVSEVHFYGCYKE